MPEPGHLSTSARGVTLIEMMVVLAILGVVAALAVPNLKPLIDAQRVRATGDEVAGFLDRARRLAYGEGRCARVSLAGGQLVLHRHDNDNCVDLNGSWQPVQSVVQPGPGVALAIENLDSSDVIIFRPNGRIRGTATPNHLIDDDGARVTVTSAQANRWVEVHVTSNARVCGRGGIGALPAMPTSITCGGNYGGGGDSPSGGGCSAVHQESTMAMFALLGLAFLRRPRRAPRATRRRPRGYLMIEVMAGGAILAVILAATVGAIAKSRTHVTRASFRAQASSYAQEWLQLMMADVALPCPADDEPRTNFTRTCAISASGLVNTDGNEEVVTITVTYPDLDGNGTQTTTLAGIRRDRN